MDSAINIWNGMGWTHMQIDRFGFGTLEAINKGE
jgi:hypothetical protein